MRLAFETSLQYFRPLRQSECEIWSFCNEYKGPMDIEAKFTFIYYSQTRLLALRDPVFKAKLRHIEGPHSSQEHPVNILKSAETVFTGLNRLHDGISWSNSIDLYGSTVTCSRLEALIFITA
jgi:hypothetical protein